MWKMIHGHVANMGERCGAYSTHARDKTDGPVAHIGNIRGHVRPDRWA
jgi:hypothetical protein